MASGTSDTPKSGDETRRRAADRRARIAEAIAREPDYVLGNAVLLARHVGVAALAIAAALVPALGPDHMRVAGLILVLVVPYNLALHFELRRTRRMPSTIIFTDQLIGVLFPLLEPGTWTPTLVVLSANVALAAAVFGARRSVAALLLGCGLLSVVGTEAFGFSEAVVDVLAYLIGGAMIVATIGLLSGGERSLRVRYDELVSGVDAVVWEADPETLRFRYVTGGAERLLGYQAEAWLETGFWADHLHPEDRDEAIAFCLDAIAAGNDHDFEYRMVAADGRAVWIHDVVHVDDGVAGRTVRGVMLDVTDRKRAEAGVRQHARIVEGIPLALLLARLDGDDLVLETANPAAAALLGLEPLLLAGRPLREALPRLATAELLPRLRKVVATGAAFNLDRVHSLTADAGRVFSLHAFPLGDDSVGISLDDVTGPAMAAAAMRRRATHDDLTALPNRMLLRDRLRQALQEGRRNGQPVALLIMDLDQFKEVNDALGHKYGDLLLIEVAKRLQDIVRECDTIARLGGDEFALLLTTTATPTGTLRVAEKVTTALARPFDIEGMSLQTNASIGIALFPSHADTAESLLQRADVAMYTAKRSGMRYALYAPDDDRSSVSRTTLLAEIHRAVRERELFVEYQPVVDLHTRSIVGAEAFVRWNHPEHGVLLPAMFVELAEVSGVIQDLTRQVIAAAVDDLAVWRAEGSDVRMSVNLSVRNLYDPDLVPWLRVLLHNADVPAAALAVELTESHLMDDTGLALERLSVLRDLGIETAIDDFGTGYSSLSYLRQLPVTEIKIDRSFVTSMVSDPNDASIVRSVIDLAHNLDLLVLAEGVEDLATLRLLTELGCDRAQGYVIGRPMAADAFASLLRGNAASASSM